MKLCGALWALTLSASATLLARADEAEKQACAASYSEGQRARKAGHLIQARSHFVLCAQQTCPSMIANDCGGWLSDLDDSLPTVVFRVRDETGVDRADAAIFVDGKPLEADTGGFALPMDPGPHHLRFERNQASFELDVVVREGEKRRPIEVTLVPLTPSPQPSEIPSVGASTLPLLPAPTAAPTRPADRATLPSAAPSEDPAQTPVLAYVALGIGVVAVGTSAVIGVGAKSDLDDLRNTCAPHCAESDVDAVHNRMLVADVTLGVGVLAALVGGYLWLSEPSSSVASPGSSHFRPGGFAFALDLP